MSIATELQNYADGLDDAYDAVNDMSGIIPQHKNMNNLDQAIRTIPQNSGITATTFHWGGSPNYSMYKDSGYTTAATYSDIATAYASGIVYIADGEDEVTYVVVSDIPDAYTITVTGIGLPGYEGASASYAYASSTWTKTATEFQTKLTAGTGINISAQNVISATVSGMTTFNTEQNLRETQLTHAIFKDYARTEPAYTEDLYNAATSVGAILFCDDRGYDESESYYITAYYDPDDGYYEIYATSGTRVYKVEETAYHSGSYTSSYIGYKDFTGATSQQAGAAGLVPGPSTSAVDKYLKGDGTWGTPTGTTYTAGTNVSISAQNVISATDTTYSDFVGATSSVAGTAGLVPAPTTSDTTKYLKGDGTWAVAEAELVEMYYGESNAWAKFIAAYNGKKIVYCRASSNANPGSGAKTRKAFMAYVNSEDSPTSVEFQYVRSVSSKTDSQQCDQVFVYTLTNSGGGTWSVTSRNMAAKVNVDSTLTKTFSNGANASMTLSAKAMTGATGSAAGTAGYVPAPAATDNTKFLRGDGTWQTVGAAPATFYWFNYVDPVSGNFYFELFTDDSHTVVATDSDVLNAFNAGGAIIYDEDAEIINTVISMDITGESFITIDANGTKEYSYNGIPLPGNAAWTRS